MYKEDIKVFEEVFEMIQADKSISDELIRDVDDILSRNQYLRDGLMQGFIEESDDTYRLSYYISEYICFLSHNDKSCLKVAIHNYDKIELSDKILKPFIDNKLTKDYFNYVMYDKGSSKLVYFDQNIISDILNNVLNIDDVKKIFNHHNMIIVYSPNHIEEANRFPSQEILERYLDILRSLTNNLCLLPCNSEDIHMLVTEDPSYSLKRIKKYEYFDNEEKISAIERYTIHSQKDREILLWKYEEEEHKKIINNSNDVFNELTDEDFFELSSLCFGSFYKKVDFTDMLVNRDSFGVKIKKLYKMLDLLGYKLEKRKNRNKPGATYDPEHLVYAFECDYFITNDEMLCQRASQIAKFINSSLECLSYKSFLDKFSS